MELTNKDLLLFLAGIIFLIWGFVIFLFGRITVKHFIREMAKEGIELSVWVGGESTPTKSQYQNL